MSERREAGVVARGRHFVGRFFGSLRPREVAAAERAWVQGVLTDPEWAQWQQLSRADRRESVDVGRRAEFGLASTARGAAPELVAAALLHDVGKSAASLGLLGRTAATVTAPVWRRRATPGEPVSSLTDRMGAYVHHAEIGAEMLHAAGARPEVVGWAAAHHDPDRWAATGIAPDACRALAAADGEPLDT